MVVDERDLEDLRQAIDRLTVSSANVLQQVNDIKTSLTVRVAVLETRADEFKADLRSYQKDHTGPGGDHDRIRSFNQFVIGALVVVGVGLLGAAAYLWMHP